jgi:hypothetical protein
MVPMTSNWLASLDAREAAYEFNKTSGWSPATVAPDDVLWDRAYWRDWTGVRSLRVQGGVMIEALDLVGTNLRRPRVKTEPSKSLRRSGLI